MKKYIYCFLMLFLCLIVPISKVNAQTLNDLYNELAELKTRKNESETQKKLTQEQINQVISTINETSKNIENTRNEIEKANKDIIASEEEIKSKDAETKELLKYLQLTSGENLYLQYIFEAEDYTDFIYRYSVVNQLSQYNNNLMIELESLIEKLEESKINLAKKEKELEKEREVLTDKRMSLGAQLRQTEDVGITIEDDIATLQKKISYYENTLGCERYEDLAVCSKIPYATGFKYPLVSGYVSSPFGYRSFMLNGSPYSDFHYAIDIAVGEGTKVYPAADGRVAMLVYRASCGGNQVYIHHNINGKSYTTSYVHLLSYNVSVGQVVTDTTVIGYSGGGSRTYGWETCSNGAHLHFGIAETHAESYNAFITYAINPTSIFTRLYHGASFYSR